MVSFDVAILHAVQSIGPYGYPVAWFLSAIIGSLYVFVPAIVLALFLMKRKKAAIEIASIFAISFVVVVLLKLLIAAPRPYWNDVSIIQYALATDYGMPSGHAFIAVVVFGWLWFRHEKSLIVSLGASLLIVLIGLSRIYLGLHTPSQVVVGWILGLVFLFIFHAIHKKLWKTL